MFALATNPDTLPDPVGTPPVQPTAFTRIGNAILGVRNRVSAAILEHILPDTMTATYEEIGCVLEYDGETQMVSVDGRMGIEVESGDLMFVNSTGVWIGLTHYDAIPEQIEEYNFITSGTRADYNTLLEAKLEGELRRQRDVVTFLMAA